MKKILPETNQTSIPPLGGAYRPVLPRAGQLILVLLLAIPAPAQLVEKPITATRTCVTDECHNTYQTLEYTHLPVARDVCKFCHRYDDPAQHTFNLLRQGSDLCVFCHRDMPMKQNGHQPLLERECIGCHNPHGSDFAFMFPTPSLSDTCRDCHDELLQDKPLLHEPLLTGECTQCHDAHTSPYDYLLLEDPNQMCFTCHETTAEELQVFDFPHQPVIEENCSICHDVHGSAHEMILQKGIPELCFECHVDIEVIVQNSRYKHSFISEPAGCSQCHTPHASFAKYNLKADPLTLCLICHDRNIVLNETKILKDFKILLENNPYQHGPIEDHECDACHNSHGSNYFRMLSLEYPSQFYAPFDITKYELCFSCHEVGLATEEKTTNRTNFRQGDLNLHYVHVIKPERGRTCRSCHATHASTLPSHINDRVEYGFWEIPIDYKKTANGGSCNSGCHKYTEYNRDILPLFPQKTSRQNPPIPNN